MDTPSGVTATVTAGGASTVTDACALTVVSLVLVAVIVTIVRLETLGALNSPVGEMLPILASKRISGWTEPAAPPLSAGGPGVVACAVNCCCAPPESAAVAGVSVTITVPAALVALLWFLLARLQAAITSRRAERTPIWSPFHAREHCRASGWRRQRRRGMLGPQKAALKAAFLRSLCGRWDREGRYPLVTRQ